MRPSSPDVGSFCGLKIVLLLSTLAFLVESFISFSLDSMNSIPNVAYYIHLAHEIPNEPERSFDHLVFFNGKTKYILAKSTFQDLNICSLGDLEGGTPFVIDDSSISEVDIKPEYTNIFKLLRFFKDDGKHAPMLLFQIAPSERQTKTKDFVLTMLEPGLDVKHPFSLTMPFYALPHVLKVVKFARISLGSKTAGFRRKTYPTIDRFVTADDQGAPTYASERALSADVLAALMTHFDARLLIGAPQFPETKFLHLSDQSIAHKRLGAELSVVSLGNSLFDIYEDNERLLSKAKKYFSPPSGSYAGVAAPMDDGERAKVILIPDFNSAFKMREAEAIAKTLFDSGRYFPWIITIASQRTNEVNFSALNSSKVNPATASEIVLFKPAVNLGQFNSDFSFNFSKSTNTVHIMAYDHNPIGADVGASTCIPSSTEELPDVAHTDQSGYDTDPSTRFIVDFAVSRQRLRNSKILDKLAKSCKFWPSPELTFRLNRHLRYTIDFSTEKAMRAFLNFCDNTKGHFAYPRNEVLTASPTSVPYFIRAARGESDPDAFLLMLQTLFNLKSSELFPVGNLTAVIRLPSNVDLPASLRSANVELEQDFFLSSYAPGGIINDVKRKRPNRVARQPYPAQVDRSDRGDVLLSSVRTWYSINGGEDFSNASALEPLCQLIKADNVHRAWAPTCGSSIIFTLQPDSPKSFEHGGRNFTVTPFTLGCDLSISPISFEPDFDKIFEIDSDEGSAVGDALFDQLIVIRKLRSSLGLDALSALVPDQLEGDEAMADSGPAGSGVIANDLPLASSDGVSNSGSPDYIDACPDCRPNALCSVHHVSTPIVPEVGGPSGPDPDADNPMNAEEPVDPPDAKRARNAAGGGSGNASYSANDKDNPAAEK